MKNIFLFLTLLVLSVCASAQQNQTEQDSTKTQKLDEILVNAVRVNATSPITHSNLTKKQLAKRNLGQDIPILLNYLPGVVTSSDAGAGVGYTYMNVRGSNSERVNVTINGIPYNDAESQGTFWVNLGDFASSIESLQLQRGVGTSTNGSAAFGASLNILTDAVSEDSYGEISSSIGSYNTFKNTIKFSTGKLNNHIEISGRLSKISSDGYVDRATSNLKSYFLQASYIDDNTLVKAITFGGKERTYQAWFGLDATQLKENRRQNPYTYEDEVDDYEQNHYQLHWNERIDNNWSTNIAFNYTKGQGFFEQYKGGKKPADFANLVVATDGSKTDLIVRRWLDNNFYVFNANVTYKDDQVNVISGISYNDYGGDHFGEIIWAKQFAPNANIRDRYYESDASKRDFSVFSKATYKITDKFSVYLDLQERFVKYKTRGLTSNRTPINVNESFSFFNPKLGTTIKLNAKNSLYASYAVANKEPNRNDYENGTNVKSENLNDFELGWRLNSNNVKLNTNLYYMLYKNQLVLTGNIDNNSGEYLRDNVARSYRLGAEIEADIKLSNKFRLLPNVALSENKIKDFLLTRDGETKNLGNTTISFSPSIVAGNSLVFMPNKNVQLALMSKYVGEQYLSNTDTPASKLKAYFTSDFNIVYEIKPKNVLKSIVLSGLVNNIFNKEYVDRGYTYLDFWSNPGNSSEIQGYYPQATINFLLGVTLKF